MNSSLPHPLTRADAPHALVIGSGFGGLAAAIRLGARGYRVSVVEKLDTPGGRARVHRQDGFTFDAGPTIITAPFLLEELWQLCGRRLQDDVDLRPMTPYYRIRFDDGETFDYSGDRAEMKAQIRRLAPGDEEGYEPFLAASEAIYRVGFEELGHRPFNSPMDMARITPAMLRLRSDRSVYRMVSRFFRSERIRQIFSFHPLLIGGNPYKVSSIYTLINFLEQRWGVHSAIGGTGRIIEGLVGLVRSQGGEIRLNSEVAEITLEQGRASGVRLTSGERLRADVVVSNADPAWTYRYLVPGARRRHWTDRRIERAHYSSGLFVWYFGTRGQYPALPHHSILLGPRYKGLLDDIFRHRRLAGDFSLYLHRPTATDAGMAPPGCDTFYALAPVPNLGGDIDWKTEAEPFRQRIAAHLEATVLPGLGEALVTSRVTTPLDFEHDLLAYRGAGFSLEPLLQQSAWFRPHGRSEDVPGLYMVGAGTHPGAGVPGVLSSARVLDEVIPHATATL